MPGADDKCNKCGAMGHWARDCPSGGDAKAGGDAAADGAALDTDLDTYFDGAKEEAAPAAGDDVMAA